MQCLKSLGSVKCQNHCTNQPKKTRAEIVALRSYGVPIKEVAAYIGIDDKTLYKYYKDELDNSAIKSKCQCRKVLYQAASGQALTTGASYSDCVRAAMFWAKTRMGWKETNVQEEENKEAKNNPKNTITINVVDARKNAKSK